MESNFSKAWDKWRIRFPNSLTEEELHLKSKYEKLKQLQQKLLLYETTGNCNSPVKCIRRVQKHQSLKQSEINSKKTCDFKKPSKQQPDKGIKRPLPKYSFEDDTKPRSIIIRGDNLENEFIQTHFDKFGAIKKIRTNDNKTCAILSFQKPNSAKKATEALDNTLRIDGKNFNVSLLKPRNTAWCNKSESNSSATSVFENQGRSVHLTLTGYLNSKDIEEFFQSVGRVTRVYLNVRKKFGFVTFENEEQSRRAIAEMNGEIYNGVKIIVSPQTFLGSDTKKASSSVEKDKREIVSYDDI